MQDRHYESDFQRKSDAGLIAAAIYNANPFRGEGAKALEPSDFVRDIRKIRTAKAREVMSLDDQIDFFTQQFGCGPYQKAS